jgi:hypothetical protein
MRNRNQVGIGLSYRPATSLCSLATQFQTRFLESIPRPIAGLKFSNQYSFPHWSLMQTSYSNNSLLQNNLPTHDMHTDILVHTLLRARNRAKHKSVLFLHKFGTRRTFLCMSPVKIDYSVWTLSPIIRERFFSLCSLGSLQNF